MVVLFGGEGRTGRRREHGGGKLGFGRLGGNERTARDELQSSREKL